jgi:hypothetical protein
MSCGGIAGNDDGFNAMSDEKLGVFDGEATDRIGRLRAVGHSGSVTKIKNGFIRQQLTQRTNDGETADAGVEYAKGCLLGF